MTIVAGASNANRAVLWTIPGDPGVEKTIGEVSLSADHHAAGVGEPSGQRIRLVRRPR